MQVYLGQDPRKSATLKKSAELLRLKPPRWDRKAGSIDMYYWYYGYLAAYQVGGVTWRAWEKSMRKAILKTQRKDKGVCGFEGSWDPIDPWGPDGGRVYATAMMTMCLETPGRYERIVGKK